MTIRYNLYIFVWIQYSSLANIFLALDTSNSIIKSFWCSSSFVSWQSAFMYCDFTVTCSINQLTVITRGKIHCQSYSETCLLPMLLKTQIYKNRTKRQRSKIKANSLFCLNLLNIALNQQTIFFISFFLFFFF